MRTIATQFLRITCLLAMLLQADAIPLVPHPTTMSVGEGSVLFGADTRILYQTRSTPRAIENTLQPLAAVLAGELEAITGIKPAIVESSSETKPGPGDISLEFAAGQREFATSEEDEDQAYTLEISDRVEIASSYSKGVGYGTTTLLQLLQEDAGSFTLPKASISDQPAASYRTVMLDLARQPSGLETVKQVVRLARQCKIRYLQLHLTDDQHFTFPFLPVTDNLTDNFTYSRDELKALAAYADARGVTIIPELDLPGHSSRLRESGYLNRDRDDADVAHPENFAKIQAIIDDMLAVFSSSPYFHIGGDESGAGESLIPFLEAMNNHLRGKPAGQKKRMLVWEGFHGSPTEELPATGDDRIIVLSWESSYNPPWDLLTSGYEVVNASWKPLYIVGSGTKSRGPHTAQRMWSVADIHAWDKNTFMHWEPGRPVFEDVGPGDENKDDGKWNVATIGRQNQVIGGQLLSWEQNEATIFRDLLPRLPAMADRLWNPLAGEDHKDFSTRLNAVAERVLTNVQPVEILPHGLNPDSPLEQDYRSYSGSEIQITLRNRTKIPATIRYETAPFNNQRTYPDFEMAPETTISSSAYTGPFHREGGFGIRAQLFRNNGTPVDGSDLQHFNNLSNLVEVTEFKVPRRPLANVPDFASYTTDQILRTYQLPALRGPYLVDQVYGQMMRSTLQVPGSGDYEISVQTSHGRASLFIDRNRDGIWNADEKLITDSAPDDVAASTSVELEPGDYQLRVDHASGAIGPILWVKINGPGTNGARDVTDFLAPPLNLDAPPSMPQLISPVDGATGVPSGRPLTWTSASAHSYDVFLWLDGTTRPSQATASGLAANVYSPADLEIHTSYRWVVVAHNPKGSSESAEGTFTTSDQAGPGPSIGWNYVGLGGGSVAATAAAGAPGFEQVNWNNHPGSGQAPGTVPFDLVDRHGSPTSAKVNKWTLSRNNSWKHDDNRTPDHALLNDFVDREPALTFSGIPYSRYDVVVYYGNNEGPSESTLQVNDQSRTIRTGNTALSFFGNVGYVEGTDENSSVPTNYSVFTGLSGASVTVSLAGANNNGISAIQIIESKVDPE